MRLYIHPKCSTCQQALKFIKAAHLPHTVIDILQTPPTIEELKKMLSYFKQDVKKLFNSSGLLYRQLELSHKLSYMPLEESLDLLNKNGMLVKRPFLLGEKIGLVGFRLAEWQDVVKASLIKKE